VIGRTLSIALLSGLTCFAQEQTARLTGTVFDPLGSPLKTATAKLESEKKTGLHYSVESNATGQFRFSDIQPATYRLTLHVQGFVTWTKHGIRLSVGERVTLPDAFLLLGRCGEPAVEFIQRSASVDDSATLRGSVLDTSRSPVIGANVALDCTRCDTKTNRKGQFVFSNLKEGKYTISISANGFYREVMPHSLAVKNLDWTYAPIQLERCPARGCGLKPRPEQIAHCE
jgi:hypothetical protein